MVGVIVVIIICVIIAFLLAVELFGLIRAVKKYKAKKKKQQDNVNTDDKEVKK